MQRLNLCLPLLFLLGLPFAAQAQDDKKEDAEKIESKAEKVQRAKFVNFSGDLGVSLSSLDCLGEKIDQARLNANCVDLAVAASLLQAAESVAGKTGKITSKALAEEAADLAKQRSNPAELATVAKLLGGAAGKDLEALAKSSKEESSEKGETKRDLYGDLIVDNHTHDELHVYVNGYEVGHVHPHEVASFHVHHAHYATARDHYGHRWHIHFPGHRHRYYWTIHDPHGHGDDH